MLTTLTGREREGKDGKECKTAVFTSLSEQYCNRACVFFCFATIRAASWVGDGVQSTSENNLDRESQELKERERERERAKFGRVSSRK